MAVKIKEVVDKSDIKTFVNLPYQLYKGNAFWIPPLKSDEKKSLHPDTNPAYEFSKAKFWIALKDGKCVGRIGAIINESYNKKMNENHGRITRMEFINDPEVSKSLFNTAEKWLKEQGIEGARGPLGFSNLDLQGLLIEGHDYLPSVGSIYHFPYYQEHFANNGYEKEIDWVEFKLKMAESIPEKALKLVDMIKRRYELEVLTFESSEELRPYGTQIFELLNTAFDDLHYVVEFNKKMIDFYVEKYFKMLNPKFVKLIRNKEKRLVGFIIALPSLSEAMQKCNGSLFPFGIFHVMKALKKPKVVDLLLTGIDPQLQGQGLSALLITELQQTLIAHGVEYVETTGIFEDNHKAIQHWKNYEHIQHKRRRCYFKNL